MARKLFCSKEQPRDRYTTISNTWSSDQLIDEPTTAEGSGNLGDTGELHDSEADYSMISVLSFLATGTEDEFVANSTSPKMVTRINTNSLVLFFSKMCLFLSKVHHCTIFEV